MSYGTRLREIRKHMGFTLEDISQKTKFTKSFISQIENGKNSPSIASLKKICSALNTTISDLFEEEKSVIHILKKSDYQVFDYNGSSFSFMAAQFSGRKLEPLLVEVAPHGETSSKNYQHIGEEFVYMVKGGAVFVIGEEEYEVNEGESVYFSSNLPHRLKNNTKDKIVAFCVGTPPSF